MSGEIGTGSSVKADVVSKRQLMSMVYAWYTHGLRRMAAMSGPGWVPAASQDDAAEVEEGPRWFLNQRMVM